jgi:hypothetical protein
MKDFFNSTREALDKVFWVSVVDVEKVITEDNLLE